MLLKWMEKLFCLQQMWGCTEPPWKYQLMRLRGETVTFCTLWVTILVKPHQERGIARKLSPSMLCEAGVKLSEWPQQQLNGKLALLKWKEYYGLGGIRTWGWDLWLKTLSVYLSFPLAPGLLLFWNREFLVALTTTPAKASNSHLALGSFSFLIRIIRAAGISQHFVSPLDFCLCPSRKLQSSRCICWPAVPSSCGNRMQALHGALHSFRSF